MAPLAGRRALRGRALRGLAKGRRSLCEAQPVTIPPSSPSIASSSVIFPQAASYQSRAFASKTALKGSYVGRIQLVHLTSTFVAPLVFLESKISLTCYSSSPSKLSSSTILGGQVSSQTYNSSRLSLALFKCITQNTLQTPSGMSKRQACKPISSIMVYLAFFQSSFFEGLLVLTLFNRSHTLSPIQNCSATYQAQLAYSSYSSQAMAITACTTSTASLSLAINASLQATREFLVVRSSSCPLARSRRSTS